MSKSLDDLMNYDPNRKKSDLELGLQMPNNNQALRELEEAKKGEKVIEALRGEEENRNIPFLAKRFFVPLDLINPEATAGSELTKKPLYISMAVTFVLAFLVISGLQALPEIMHIPTPLYLVISLILVIVVNWMIWAKFYFNIEENRQRRQEKGSTTSSSLSQIWGINPNGIKSEYIGNKEFQKVIYNSKESILLKLTRTSILSVDENLDWQHYASIAELETVLTQSGLCYTKVIKSFDTENDNIWDVLNNNLQDAVKQGESFMKIMHDMMVYNKNITKEISTLNVLYYIIYPHSTIKEMDLTTAVRVIADKVKSSRLELGEVTYREYISILKEYTGLDINIEKILEGVEQDTKLEVQLLKVINSEGELITYRDLPKEEIKSPYTHEVKDLEEDRLDKDIYLKKDIFVDEIYHR